MMQESPVDQSLSLEPKYAAELDLVQRRMESEGWKKIEMVEDLMETAENQIIAPLNHVFTPGLYVREAFLERGSLYTSRIHLTEHPFIISSGIVSVWDDISGWVTYRAPHTGITKPGTRRVLFIHEDTIWSTCHANPTNETDPDKIIMAITFTGGKFSQLRGAAAVPVLSEKGTQ